MQSIDDVLARLPHTALVNAAKEMQVASMAHGKEELARALLTHEDLRADPIQVLRRRVFNLISNNKEQLKGRIDPVCAECHACEQQKCHDMRVVGDYLVNLDLINFEEKS